MGARACAAGTAPSTRPGVEKLLSSPAEVEEEEGLPQQLPIVVDAREEAREEVRDGGMAGCLGGGMAGCLGRVCALRAGVEWRGMCVREVDGALARGGDQAGSWDWRRVVGDVVA